MIQDAGSHLCTIVLFKIAALPVIVCRTFTSHYRVQLRPHVDPDDESLRHLNLQWIDWSKTVGQQKIIDNVPNHGQEGLSRSITNSNVRGRPPVPQKFGRTGSKLGGIHQGSQSLILSWAFGLAPAFRRNSTKSRLARCLNSMHCAMTSAVCSTICWRTRHSVLNLSTLNLAPAPKKTLRWWLHLCCDFC